MIISTASSLAAHRLHIRWAGAAAAHRRAGLPGSRKGCSRWTRGVKKRIAAASHEVAYGGLPQAASVALPAARPLRRRRGAFMGVASGNFGEAFALKLGLPEAPSGQIPFCPLCFLQELSAFEVERDAQGPCCRQDGVPLARAGPRGVSDDAQPVPGGGTYGTLYEISLFKYCGALFGQTHPKRHQCCHRSTYVSHLSRCIAAASSRSRPWALGHF